MGRKIPVFGKKRKFYFGDFRKFLIGADNTTKNLQDYTKKTYFGVNFDPNSTIQLNSVIESNPWDSTQITSAVHPSVLYFENGVDGYKYWMVFTPLGNRLDQYNNRLEGTDFIWENPTLLLSNDGINWIKPNDINNPLVRPLTKSDDPNLIQNEAYYADPKLVYAPGKGPNGSSWLLYYQVIKLTNENKEDGTTSGMYLAYSFDGKNYIKYNSNQPVLAGGSGFGILYDTRDNLFKAWSSGDGSVHYSYSSNGVDWIDTGVVLEGGKTSKASRPPYVIGHIDVILYEGRFWMYYFQNETSYSEDFSIGMATSIDGIKWDRYYLPVLSAKDIAENWFFHGDNTTAKVKSLYKPSPIIVGNEMKLYFTGMSRDEFFIDFEIGLTKSQKSVNWAKLSNGHSFKDLSSIKNVNNQQQLFAISSIDGSLWTNIEFSENNWSGWKNLDGLDILKIAVEKNQDGCLQVFAINQITKMVWTRYQLSPGSDDWSSWQILGSGWAKDIIVTKTSDNRIQLFGISDANNTVWTNYQNTVNAYDTSGWNGWIPLGDLKASQIMVEKNSSNFIELFIVCQDDQMVYKNIQKSTYSYEWSGWDVQGNGKVKQITLSMGNDQNIHLFGISYYDDSVWAYTPDGWITLDSYANNLVSIRNVTGEIILYTLGKDNQVLMMSAPIRNFLKSPK